MTKPGDIGGLPRRARDWADDLQRRHTLFGFPYAVIRRYVDDSGARLAALITYYGFLSIFPLLLLVAVAISVVLRNNVQVRQELIAAVVPAQFADTVNTALASLPTSGVATALGLIGLIFSSLGIVTSGYHTLNNLATVPYRVRPRLVRRYLRTTLLVLLLVVAAVGMGALTLLAGVATSGGGESRLAAVTGISLITFLLLWASTALLLPRRPRLGTVWPGALIGSLAIALVLTFGAALLPMLAARYGPVYGSFAAIAGLFALMFVVGQALVFAGEIAVVHARGLWPRSLDPTQPTDADVRSLTALARMQEWLPVERVQARFDAPPERGLNP